MNHTVTMQRNIYKDGWTSEIFIVIRELRNTFFALGGADLGREEYQGELRKDIVFISGRPTVIDNHGGTGADMKRNGRIDVKLGDSLTLHFGDKVRTFTVRDSGDRYNAKLVERRTK